MASPSEQILDALNSRSAPDAGWSGPVLRGVLGLSVGSFAGALLLLRRQGLVHPDRIALAGSALPVSVPADAEALPEPVPLTETVKAEATARVASRVAARSTGSVVGKRGEVVPVADDLSSIPGLSLGGRMQAAGLQDNVLEAASIVRARWNAVWKRVCLFAGMTGDRPIPAMIALLEQALDAADVPEGDAAGFRRAADIGANHRPTAFHGGGA